MDSPFIQTLVRDDFIVRKEPTSNNYADPERNGLKELPESGQLLSAYDTVFGIGSEDIHSTRQSTGTYLEGFAAKRPLVVTAQLTQGRTSRVVVTAHWSQNGVDRTILLYQNGSFHVACFEKLSTLVEIQQALDRGYSSFEDNSTVPFRTRVIGGLVTDPIRVVVSSLDNRAETTLLVTETSIEVCLAQDSSKRHIESLGFREFWAALRKICLVIGISMTKQE